MHSAVFLSRTYHHGAGDSRTLYSAPRHSMQRPSIFDAHSPLGMLKTPPNRSPMPLLKSNAMELFPQSLGISSSKLPWAPVEEKLDTYKSVQLGVFSVGHFPCRLWTLLFQCVGCVRKGLEWIAVAQANPALTLTEIAGKHRTQRHSRWNDMPGLESALGRTALRSSPTWGALLRFKTTYQRFSLIKL